MQRCLVALVFLVLVLPACGGGSSSSGPTYSNATWAGDYSLVCISGSQTNTTARAVFGTLTADGSGSVSGTTTDNVDGVPGTPSMGPPSAYAIAADGTVTFEGLTGAITADGEVLVLCDLNTDGEPLICIMLRRSGTYSNASLSGNYYMGGIKAQAAKAETHWTQTGLGPVSFDGASMTTHPTVAWNDAGTVTTVTGGNAIYAVAADGTATMGTTWFGTAQGGVADDNSLVIYGGATNASSPFMKVYTRQGAGLNNSVLSGEYALVSIEATDGADPQYSAYLGVAVADGAGGLSIDNLTRNTEGTITPQGPEAAAYTVGATGHFTVGNLEGAVSPEGRFAWLSGGTGNGDGPQLLFMVRR